MRSIAYHQSGTLCISSISKKLHIIKQTDFLCTPKGVMRYNSLCELMIYTLKRGDIPSLSAWIKKSRSVERDFLAPQVGLEPTTLSVRNIVALLAWSASQCSLFLPAQSTASSAAGSAVLRALTRSAPNIQSI